MSSDEPANPYLPPASAELAWSDRRKGVLIATPKKMALLFVAIPIVYTAWVSIGFTGIVGNLRHQFMQWRLGLPIITHLVLATYQWWWLAPVGLAGCFTYLLVRKNPSRMAICGIFLLASVTGALLHTMATVAFVAPFLTIGEHLSP